MATSIGSGLGGFAAVVAQPTYGATFVTPTRTLDFKSGKATWNPHPVQGGPYLAEGRIVNTGAAHVLIYRDATGTLDGDMMNSGMALLLAAAVGSSGTLTQSGTTTAYELGGAGGISIGAPDKNIGGSSGTCFDMQWGPPITSGEQQKVNFHSCFITKATWVFDRTGLVTYSYDFDAQFVEQETALISPAFSTAHEPFSMSNASAAFKLGAFGSEAAVEGARKVTVTLTRKMDASRIYLGEEKKAKPISNNVVDIDVAIDFDYTSAAKTYWEKWVANESTSLVLEAVGASIGSSGKKNTFVVNPTNLFVETGAEANLIGPDVVKNTLMYRGTIDAANDTAFKAKLITADTTF